VERGRRSSTLALEPVHQGETPVSGYQGAEPVVATPAPERPALPEQVHVPDQADPSRTAGYVTRMPGGVGGAAPRGVPLSRSSAHRRHPTSNRAGYAFNLSETAPANTENGRDRERPEHQRAGGFFVARNSPAFPSRRVVYCDRSTRRTNRGRETMRDDPWTAANRDKEQQKVTIPPKRQPTAETASPPSKPTVTEPFWTGKKSAPDVPKPQGVVDARQRTDD
jgi:hypothetical protein